MGTINCEGRSIREINTEIKQLLAAGTKEIVVQNTAARHNLGVGLVKPGKLRYEGSVGYYCCGMMDGPTVEITGSAGWGLAESMMNGTVIVRGSAGNAAAATIRGGTVIIHGDAAARLGVALKGGLILVGGNCGYMAGFMAQKGMLIVCGDVGAAFGDSMYETVCFVGGNITELGNDAVIEELTKQDEALLRDTLKQYMPKKAGTKFKKVVSGRKLWNFSKQERAVWKEAL